MNSTISKTSEFSARFPGAASSGRSPPKSLNLSWEDFSVPATGRTFQLSLFLWECLYLSSGDVSRQSSGENPFSDIFMFSLFIVLRSLSTAGPFRCRTIRQPRLQPPQRNRAGRRFPYVFSEFFPKVRSWTLATSDPDSEPRRRPCRHARKFFCILPRI